MTNKIKILNYLLITTLAVNLLFGFQVYSAIEKETGEEAGYKMMRQFASVLKLIRKNYVDESKIGYEDLVNEALEGMLSSLDDFSSYIDPQEYERMREETDGEFGGIGVVISVEDGELTVVAPMEDTPGQKAGIRTNDRIIKIGGQETIDLSLDQAVNLIKGPPGTPVELTIYRPSTNETKVINVERGIIELKTIKDVRHIEPGIGYLRITQFNDKTANSLQNKLQKLEAKGLKGLIMDLRNNPGGLLTSSIDVSSLFIPRRQLIVFTEGRPNSVRQEYKSSSEKKFLDFPIVILINEGSASAAEIVAGCLQDYGRALLVGEKSFGKGSVQSIIEVDDGSAVRITTAKYYTPGERVIHEQGIEPDFVVDISDETSQKLFMQRSRLTSVDDIEDTETIEDLQLSKGIEVLKDLITTNETQAKDYARVIKSKKARINKNERTRN